MKSGDIVRLTQSVWSLPKGTYLKLMNQMAAEPFQTWSAEVLNTNNTVTNLQSEHFEVLTQGKA